MTVSSEAPAGTAPQPKRSTATAGWWTKKTETKAAHKRICQELRALWLDPPAYCRPGAAPVTDPFHWEVVIDGPPGTPYAGGAFPVDVWYPNAYPFQPPKLTFKTKVYHPNIDEEGQMVVDALQDYWTPAFTIKTLLLCFVSVLYDPLLDYPINEDIAEQYEYEYEL
ncbi:hypothetical protein E2562_035077 [Oryza meyeriana var. granulata]|uniref:UBC core domain-containing protein n=1 Tax=Oryza meyeriana var. granulata TaxID=110450 RepID=A0A6G1FFR5_9ORYZ|nr:hypothetical protein E2562_035077 [Oryza meyeriana var. granulata]